MLEYVNPDERKRIRYGLKTHSRAIEKRNRLLGQRFGTLTVIERLNGAYWVCRCDCGKEITSYRGNLTSGNTKSCGCQRWNAAQRAKLSAAAKRRWAKPCHPSLSAE